MTKEQQYFLNLVRSHLNNEIPEAPKDIDFSELFKVCEIQNMTAIAAIELKKLPADKKLTKEQFSPFNQVLGLTIQNYEYKLKGIELLNNTLCKNKIKHLFLKGAAIRALYPVPEVRTSGDTDVVVDSEILEKTSSLLESVGFEIIRKTDIEADLKYCGEEYEVKNFIEYINDSCREFFADTFDLNKCTTDNGFTFTLKPIYHLIYITYHMLKHFKSGGAGVRQLADIDILIRNCDIDIDEYFRLCKELNFEKSAKVLVSLSKLYFNTPVNTDYEIGDELKSLLDDVILNGGTFGYGIGNIGTAHLMRAINSSKSSSKTSSVKALLGLFAVNKEFLYHNYEYARNHHILLPVAYLSRLYSAVFKRGKQNVRNIKSMFTDRETATKLSEILNELEI